MKSLRGRLLVWLIGLLTAVGLLAGVAAYLLDLDEVDGFLDGQLRQIAVNTGDTPRSGLGGSLDIDPEDEFIVT
ncbi:MAG: hypothetical protein J0H63_04490, partial [Rhizobiales bacterium]|nr:hypothetical protein [Hyphomicrobiales bacterium]